MDNEILTGLNKEIVRIQTAMQSVEPASQEYEYLSDRLKDLEGLRLNEKKHDDDVSAQAAAVERDLIKKSEETERYEKEQADREKDRKANFLLRVAEIATPTIAGGVMFLLGLNFEKTGNICSPLVRNTANKVTTFWKK